MTCFPLSESLKFETLQTTIHKCSENIGNDFSDLNTDLVGLIEWFRINSLQADPVKFQLLVPEIKNERPFHTYINQVKLNTQTK